MTIRELRPEPEPRLEPVAMIEDISPEKARAMLGKNPRNRKIVESYLVAIKGDIERDKFYITNQGIGIDWNGDILDGQHRLLSIARGTKTVRMLVVRGIDPAAMYAIDGGRKRLFGHDLDIEGWNEYSATAAMVRKVASVLRAWQRGIAYYTARSHVFTRFELRELLEDMNARGDVNAAVRTGNRVHRANHVPTSAISAAYYLAEQEYGSRFVEDFFFAVRKGVMLDATDPEHKLRVRYNSELTTIPKPSSDLYLAWTLKALKMKHDGNTRGRIEFKGRNPKDFPRL